MVALISFDSDHFHPNFPGGGNSRNEIAFILLPAHRVLVVVAAANNLSHPVQCESDNNSGWRT